MPNFRGFDSDIGWQKREFAKVWRAIREANAAKRLRTSSFSDVPPSSIPSTLLINPSAPGFVNLLATGFTVVPAGANLLTSTVAVPTGYSSCVVSLVGRVFAYNRTATNDYLYARAEAATATGNALPLPVALAGSQNDSGIAVATLTTMLTNLNSTFDLRLWAKTATGSWTADAGNTADLTGTLLWFN